jgi:hypothetical protein
MELKIRNRGNILLINNKDRLGIKTLQFRF